MNKAFGLIFIIITALAWTYPACAQSSGMANDGDWMSLDDIMREDGITAPNGQKEDGPSNALIARGLAVQPNMMLQSRQPRLTDGDQFSVTVAGHEELSKIYRVDDFGEAELELLGPLIVRGLAFEDLAVNIERLYNRQYLQNAKVKIERYYPPIMITLAPQNGGQRVLTVQAETTLYEAVKSAGVSAALTEKNIIILKSPARQALYVINRANLGQGGYLGPQIKEADTIMIGEWHKVITGNEALKKTPYLEALLKRSMALQKPY